MARFLELPWRVGWRVAVAVGLMVAVHAGVAVTWPLQRSWIPDPKTFKDGNHDLIWRSSSSLSRSVVQVTRAPGVVIQLSSGPNGSREEHIQPPAYLGKALPKHIAGDSALFTREFFYSNVAYGWPFRFVEGGVVDYYTRDSWTWSQTDCSIPVGTWLSRYPSIYWPDTRLLPYRPIMAGLIGSTLCWTAAVLGVEWCIRGFVHRRRRRASRCAQCGYSLVNIQGACPECGGEYRRSAPPSR